MALHVELNHLKSRGRSLDVQITQLTAERRDVEDAVKALGQRLKQRPAFVPASGDEEVAARLAALFLGDVEPHRYQILAACAMHAGQDVFVVQSAGRGKSLCFQLAGLMLPPPLVPSAPKLEQLLVVLSPLVALAHEQAAAINAVCKYIMADGERVQSAYVLDGGGGDLLQGLDGAAPPSIRMLSSARCVAMRGMRLHCTQHRQRRCSWTGCRNSMKETRQVKE